MSNDLDFDGWVCPVPLRDTPTIVMGHGGGGAMSGELVEQLFLPAFGGAARADLGDSAVLSVPAGRLAFSTDSFVVKPMFFPGGSIGDLAVNGTVNDLAMSGATPLLPLDRVHPGRGHRADRHRTGRDGARQGRARSPASSSSPATPRWWTAAAATASTSTPPASAWSPTASTSVRPGPRSATP